MLVFAVVRHQGCHYFITHTDTFQRKSTIFVCAENKLWL